MSVGLDDSDLPLDDLDTDDIFFGTDDNEPNDNDDIFDEDQPIDEEEF